MEPSRDLIFVEALGEECADLVGLHPSSGRSAQENSARRATLPQADLPRSFVFMDSTVSESSKAEEIILPEIRFLTQDELNCLRANAEELKQVRARLVDENALIVRTPWKAFPDIAVQTTVAKLKTLAIASGAGAVIQTMGAKALLGHCRRPEFWIGKRRADYEEEHGTDRQSGD